MAVTVTVLSVTGSTVTCSGEHGSPSTAVASVGIVVGSGVLDTLGFGVAYEFKPPAGMSFLNKAALNLRYDRIKFDYDDFRDLTTTGFPPGEEPLYQFDADVIRFFFSAWF